MAQSQQHAWDIFLHLFPTSVVDAMARGDILQLVVFSTFFGGHAGTWATPADTFADFADFVACR